jgi:hypothetical protein
VSQKKSRLQRQAKRLMRSKEETEAREAIREVVKARDKALAEANAAYKKALGEAQTNLLEDRKRAWDDYEGERAEIIKKFASKEAA